MAGVVTYKKLIVFAVVFQISSCEDEVFPKVEFQNGLINVAIGKLVFFLVVAGEELINHFLVTDGTNGSKELIHVEGFELGFKELRTEDILITERTGTDIQGGVPAHVGQARIPKGNDAVLLDDFKTDALKGDGIGGFALCIYQFVFLIDSGIYVKCNGRYFFQKFVIHVAFVFFEPVVFAKVNAGGIGYTGDALVVWRATNIGTGSTK